MDPSRGKDRRSKKRIIIEKKRETFPGKTLEKGRGRKASVEEKGRDRKSFQGVGIFFSVLRKTWVKSAAFCGSMAPRTAPAFLGLILKRTWAAKVFSKA